MEGIVFLNKGFIHRHMLCMQNVRRHRIIEEKVEWVNFNYIPKNKAVDTNDMYNCQRQGSSNSIQHCLCSCINFSSNKKSIGEENSALRIHAAATRRLALFPKANNMMGWNKGKLFLTSTQVHSHDPEKFIG